MFRDLWIRHQNDGLLLGSALDLLIGNSYPAINYDFRHIICNALLSNGLKRKIKGLCVCLVYDLLKRVSCEDPFDAACSYHIESRVKHWYNYNLISPFMYHKLIIPYYDRDFLKAVFSLLRVYRKDDKARRILLSTDMLNIRYANTMKPAYISTGKVVEDTAMLSWFNKGEYSPSNMHDSNFMEWFRVYPEYKRFLYKTLIEECIFMSKFFDLLKIRQIIEDHANGKFNYYKELMLLCSVELFYRKIVNNI